MSTHSIQLKLCRATKGLILKITELKSQVVMCLAFLVYLQGKQCLRAMTKNVFSFLKPIDMKHVTKEWRKGDVIDDF